MADIETAEAVLPLSLAYNSQQTNSSRYQKRLVNYLYPTQSGDLNSSSGTAMILRFLIGSNYFLDTKKSYLAFDAYINETPNANDTVHFVDNTGAWLKRISVYTAMGVLIDEVRDCDILAAMLTRDMEPVYGESVSRECEAFWGTGFNALTPAQKQNLSLQRRRYICSLNASGFLNSFNLLPLMAMSQGNSNSFQIEIEFNNPQNVIVGYLTSSRVTENGTNTNGQLIGGTSLPTGSVAYNYTISKCYYVQSLLEDSMKEAETMAIIRQSPFILSYQAHRHYGSSLTVGSSATQTTINITEFQESVQDIKFVFRKQTNTQVQNYNSYIFSNPNLIQTQLQIGTTYIPSQPTPCGEIDSNNVYIAKMAEIYMELTSCYGKIKKHNYGFQPNLIGLGTTNLLNYFEKDFNDLVLTFDLRIFGDDAVGDPRYNFYYSGINTKSNPQPIQFIFTINGSAKSTPDDTATNGTVYLVDAFTSYISSLVIQAGEVYVIS